jgi:diguanylate cyclase (GGDEF)-like protein
MPLMGMPAAAAAAESYRRLADVFHHLLSEQSLEALLETVANTLADLVPYEALHVYETDERARELVPVLLRSEWAAEIFASRPKFGEGITGWAVENLEPVLTNAAHRDPRVKQVPGTPLEPEALITVPLIARGALKGALNIYRIGPDAQFDDEEFDLAKRFADAVALALDNAQIRARLEHQAQTDSLTNLYNHRHYHERLRGELTRASRANDTVAVLMLDIDHFKKVNDVYGHGVGDDVLITLADLTRSTVRGSDVACRVGGEEFTVIMPSCAAEDAEGLARRLLERVGETVFGAAGEITLSVGIAQGPLHAMSPRELTACAEAAMMTAKARGGDGVVIYSEDAGERPVREELSSRDARSIAHLKMLQSLTSSLNRLNDVRAIGAAIVDELRTLIDYHNCRVAMVEGEFIVPIAFRGRFSTEEEPRVERLVIRVGEGITGRVVESGESSLVPNVLECDYAQQVPGTDPLAESILAVPLRYGTRVIGVIVVSKLGVEQFDEDDLRLLEVLAGHASVALENARLFENERREAANANALLEFTREISNAGTFGDTAQRIVDLSARMLDAPQTSLWLQDSVGGDLVALAAHGVDDERRRHLRTVAYADDLARAHLDGDKPYLLSPGTAVPVGSGPAPEPNLSYVVAPLTVEGRLGCLAAALRHPAETAFTDNTRRVLAGLADQAKLALSSAGSFESLERTFVSTVESLANALEANDHYTSTHTRWITDCALEVGRSLGLSQDGLKRLEYGALFHDIGKIGIPTDVLLKPGPLTDDERTLVEKHPELGERILSPIERLADVRPIVRHCHERWDGAGYPDRLAGPDIPLESRIIFVCDAFHAMVTDRPYRERLPSEEAHRRLVQAAGTQFDPQVVETFLSLELPPPADD